MKEVLKAEMTANSNNVEMNEYIESFIAHVTVGMVRTLKGVDFLKKIEIKNDNDEITIMVNGEDISLTPFTNEIICSTLKGMIQPLKGIGDGRDIKIKVDITS